MDEGAVARAVEFDLVVRAFAQAQESLQPEFIGVLEQILEARRRDAAAHALGFAGFGDRAQFEFVGDLPVGGVFRGERRVEEVPGAGEQFGVVGQEEQPGRTQAVAFFVMAQDDDVQSALGVVALEAFSAASESFEREGGVGEVLIGAGQTDLLAEFGRHESVGMDGLGNEVVGQAEDDQVGGRFPGGFHPARHVDRLGGQVASVALVGRAREGQSDPVARAHAFKSRGFRLHGRDGVLKGIGDLFRERRRFLRFFKARLGEADQLGKQFLRFGVPQGT